MLLPSPKVWKAVEGLARSCGGGAGGFRGWGGGKLVLDGVRQVKRGADRGSAGGRGSGRSAPPFLLVWKTVEGLLRGLAEVGHAKSGARVAVI